MNIEFGCGHRAPRDGFLGCDTRQTPTTAWVCDAWDITRFVRPDSVGEIYSRHFFEHLTFAQGLRTLRAWHRILRGGGKVTLITPDLQWHCDQFLNNRAEYASTRGLPETGIFGWQRETEESECFSALDTSWDVHKSGYDFITLRKAIVHCGFVGTARVSGDPRYDSDHPKHLHVEFFKPSAPPVTAAPHDAVPERR